MLIELYGTTYTVSDLFDFDAYRRYFETPPFATPEEALNHYNVEGWQKGLNPSTLFDTKFYLKSNPDLHAVGSPLSHYLKHGQFEGRRRLSTVARTEALSPQGLTLYEKLKPHADPAYYFAQSGHPLACDVDPVMHYFAYGHGSRLRLTDKFDNQFYLDHNPDVARSGQEPLIHYTRFGWREMRRSGPGPALFPLPPADAEKVTLIQQNMEAEYYQSKLPWLKETDADPAAHYLFFGERAGYDPSVDFSSAYYLQENGDVREMGFNAYYHYLAFGAREGRQATPTGYSALRASKITPEDFDDLGLSPGYLPYTDPVVPFVFVLFPVYRGYDETLGALKAALTAHNTSPFKILVMDDHSPDARLTDDLAAICQRLGVGYCYNEDNLGFVGNINRGLAATETAGAHVILLNADTIVYDGWIDRMRAHLEADANIATITPMSNNATILSYPRTLGDNRFNLEVSHSELARMALDSPVAPVDLVTGVGFAMFISRAALERVGRLDVAFGKGYGEEVDFCQRAALEGMRNIVAPDVFVTHFGSVSFLDAQKKANAKGQEILGNRYPGYEMAVFDFIQGDPLLPARQAYDLERLARLCRLHPYVISISHALTGGVRSYVDSMAELARSSGAGLIDISLKGFEVSIRPRFPDAKAGFDNLDGLPLETFNTIMERLAPGSRWFLFNSMIGAGVRLRDSVTRLLTEHADKLVYVLHDYAANCPRANFTHVTQTYCDGVQPVEKCRSCVRTFSTTPDLDVEQWRLDHSALLKAAARVISPTECAPAYLWEQTAQTVLVRPHWEPDLNGLRPLNAKFPVKQEKRVFAVLGAIGPHKGSRILRALKLYLNQYDIEMEIHLIGYCDLQDLADGRKIFVHGAYEDNGDAIAMINKIRPDAVLSLSTWPETYCYALSIPMALGLPILAFDIGAQGERIGSYSRGVLLDFALRHTISDLATELLTADIDALWHRPVAPWNKLPYNNIEAYIDQPGEQRVTNPVAEPPMAEALGTKKRQRSLPA
ncbi:glycosyl transferase group 1 family protein [Asticcacaulis biprosthecium C19]|uniref:Glycosyl transferase group 1 family protein n=1 Tax=Asticcacaulis biprosthecium C19 TaxID=715226 RepID=F4QM16_9CAUL|nr:glycosyltransferase [Asticcacaulis biprosthecium]EGF93588.1 glycosyl transferase group 1 family protein [Asticcacaulis biprosthecium C19]